MSILDKPWLPERGIIDNAVGGGSLALPSAKVALRFLMAIITVLFMLFAVANKMRMGLDDWRALEDPSLLWLNTGFLVLSSFALQWAVTSARRGRGGNARLGLMLGGALAIAFLIGQTLAWLQLRAAGFYAVGNPANAFFYLITAMHGLHMLGGLVAWGKSMARMWQGVGMAEARLGLELCAAYWHFLLVVWLGLFAMLLAT
jgi:cytochrome c oxidase subunit 3